jgi:hypothetical protein
MVVRIEPLAQKLLAQAPAAVTRGRSYLVPGGLVVLSWLINWSLK